MKLSLSSSKLGQILHLGIKIGPRRGGKHLTNFLGIGEPLRIPYPVQDKAQNTRRLVLKPFSGNCYRANYLSHCFCIYLEYKQTSSSESIQLYRQYTVDRLKQNYIPCVGKRSETSGTSLYRLYKGVPPPPRPIGNDLRRRLANSHVTSLDYGQYAGRACSRAILNEIREPESFIHTIKLHYICSRLKKAT